MMLMKSDMQRFRFDTLLALFAVLATACTREGTTSGSASDPVVDVAEPDQENRNAVLAGGCFWCTEAVFERLKGVSEVVSGYAGGSAANANYRAVASGRSRHAEAIRITYEPEKITYGQLLKVFFIVAHDPTQKDRQGPDSGRQYRSAIFTDDQKEMDIAEAYVRQLEQDDVWSGPIVTTIEPLGRFYPAEAYHQDFVLRHPRHPYIVTHALPKVAKLTKKFSDLVIDSE